MTQPEFPVGQYTKVIVKGLIFRICDRCVESRQLEALNRSKAYGRLAFVLWKAVLRYGIGKLSRRHCLNG